MDNKMCLYIKKHHMIEEHDLVVVGVSGGPDSMCLFHMLLQLQKKIPFTMGVVHVNHMLRVEAGEEARYVEKVCEKYQIPCRVVTVAVEQFAKKKKISTEEAGRFVRYEAFHKMIDKMQENEAEKRSGKIAIAHNKNDCAETVIFHLFRGTGMQGLSGILPVNGKIIRPLLCFEREEIELYLHKNKIEFCTDATNAGDIYTRNRIRHHILPYAEEKICENVVSHISETADMIQEAQDFILKTVADERLHVVTKIDEKSILIKKTDFDKLHSAIQTELIRQVIFEVAEQKKDISKSHISDIQMLFDKQVGKMITLPYQVQAIRSYKGVLIEKEKEETEMFKPIKLFAGEIEGSMFGKLSIEIIEASSINEIPEKKYTKWFDYDKITKCLILRTRLNGDYLTINSRESKKTLKEYMINEKISQGKRKQMLVIADGNHIVWIIGYRISQAYKVTKDTKRIIKIEIIKES